MPSLWGGFPNQGAEASGRAELVLVRKHFVSQADGTQSQYWCLGAMAGALRFSHYVSGAGFGSPCLKYCEKEASLSAACARSFTRESFSKSANGFAVSMRPSS